MQTPVAFKRLFLYALLPQVAVCVLILAFGLGSNTFFFNLLAIIYAPVVFALMPLVKFAHSWAAIGLFTFAFPLIGAALYSWLFAVIVTRLGRRRVADTGAVDG